MAAGIKDIITQLEQQRVAIERALSALREVDENPTVSAPAASSASPSGKAAAKKKRKGGTAKFKKGSMVLVPHTDQVGRQVAAGLTVGLAGWHGWWARSFAGAALLQCDVGP